MSTKSVVKRAAMRSASPHGTLAWLAVVQAYNLCDAVMASRLAALDLRIGEHEVLATLATTPGITQQVLAARCFVTKSGVSMLLTQMEARGLVVREADADDARRWSLWLTPTGAALARRALAVQAEVVGAMASVVPDADLATVARVMEGASARLEALRSGDRTDKRTVTPAGERARRPRTPLSAKRVSQR